MSLALSFAALGRWSDRLKDAVRVDSTDVPQAVHRSADTVLDYPVRQSLGPIFSGGSALAGPRRICT